MTAKKTAESSKFHCGGCGKNYDTEEDVEKCSARHANKQQTEDQRIEANLPGKK